MTKNRLLEKLKTHGQQHLLDHWDQLTDAEQLRLSGQIEQVDFELLAQLLSGDTGAPDWEAVAARALPPRAIRTDGQDNAFSRPEALSRGESTLRAGRAAMILVAGGQGTRLGFDHPEGYVSAGASLGPVLIPNPG